MQGTIWLAFSNQFAAATHALKTEFPYGFDRRSAFAKPEGEEVADSVFFTLSTQAFITATVGHIIGTTNTGNTDFPNSLQWSHGLVLKLVFFPCRIPVSINL